MLQMQLADEDLVFSGDSYFSYASQLLSFYNYVTESILSKDGWQKLLQLRKFQTLSNDSPKCLKCANLLKCASVEIRVIPWEVIGRRVLLSLGVRAGWDALKEAEVPMELLRSDLLHQIVQAKAVEHQQRCCIYNRFVHSCFNSTLCHFSVLLRDLLNNFDTDQNSNHSQALPLEVCKRV
jgi:hypothetical protein